MWVYLKDRSLPHLYVGIFKNSKIYTVGGGNAKTERLRIIILLTKGWMCVTTSEIRVFNDYFPKQK